MYLFLIYINKDTGQQTFAVFFKENAHDLWTIIRRPKDDDSESKINQFLTSLVLSFYWPLEKIIVCVVNNATVKKCSGVFWYKAVKPFALWNKKTISKAYKVTKEKSLSIYDEKIKKSQLFFEISALKKNITDISRYLWDRKYEPWFFAKDTCVGIAVILYLRWKHFLEELKNKKPKEITLLVMDETNYEISVDAFDFWDSENVFHIQTRHFLLFEITKALCQNFSEQGVCLWQNVRILQKKLDTWNKTKNLAKKIHNTNKKYLNITYKYISFAYGKVHYFVCTISYPKVRSFYLHAVEVAIPEAWDVTKYQIYLVYEFIKKNTQNAIHVISCRIKQVCFLAKELPFNVSHAIYRNIKIQWKKINKQPDFYLTHTFSLPEDNPVFFEEEVEIKKTFLDPYYPEKLFLKNKIKSICHQLYIDAIVFHTYSVAKEMPSSFGVLFVETMSLAKSGLSWTYYSTGIAANYCCNRAKNFVDWCKEPKKQSNVDGNFFKTIYLTTTSSIKKAWKSTKKEVFSGFPKTRALITFSGKKSVAGIKYLTVEISRAVGDSSVVKKVQKIKEDKQNALTVDNRKKGFAQKWCDFDDQVINVFVTRLIYGTEEWYLKLKKLFAQFKKSNFYQKLVFYKNSFFLFLTETVFVNVYAYSSCAWESFCHFVQKVKKFIAANCLKAGKTIYKYLALFAKITKLDVFTAYIGQKLSKFFLQYKLNTDVRMAKDCDAAFEWYKSKLFWCKYKIYYPLLDLINWQLEKICEGLWFCEKHLFSATMYVIYKYKYRFTNKYSVDEEVLWEYLPDTPPNRYNYLHVEQYREKYKDWNILKTYFRNVVSIYMSEQMKKLLAKESSIEKLYPRLPLALIKFNEKTNPSMPFEFSPIDLQYDAIFVDDRFAYATRDDIDGRKADVIPLINTIQERSARCPIFLANILQNLSKIHEKLPTFEPSVQLYEYLFEPSHLINFVSRYTTSPQSYLTDSEEITASYVVPWEQRRAHYIWWKLWATYRNKKNAYLKKCSHSFLTLFEDEIHQFNDSWVAYAKQPIPKQNWGAWLFGATKKVFDSEWSIANSIRECKLVDFVDVWIFALKNIAIQKKLQKPFIYKTFDDFFYGCETDIKSNKHLVRFQHRNSAWYKKLSPARKTVKQALDLHKSLLLTPGYTLKGSDDYEFINAFKPPKQKPELFSIPKVFPENVEYSSEQYESFVTKFEEKQYWLSPFSFEEDVSAMYRESKNIFISARELELSINKKIAPEINEINKLLNEQPFTVFPISSATPNFLMHKHLCEISELFDKFKLPKSASFTQNPKDIYFPNISGKTCHDEVNWMTLSEGMMKQWGQNLYFAKRLSRLQNNPKNSLPKNFYEMYPMNNYYEQECAKFKSKIFRNILKNAFTIDCDPFNEDGFCKKFEKEEVWGSKDCSLLYKQMQKWHKNQQIIEK